MIKYLLIPRPTPEGQHPAACHVERRDICDDRRQQKQQPVQRRLMMQVRQHRKCTVIAQDQVFRPIAAHEWRAGDREYRNSERNRGDRELLCEPAKLRQFLLVMGRMNHASGAEKQQGFEECVRDEME